MTLRSRKLINGAMTVVCGCALLIALVPLALRGEKFPGADSR